MYFYIIYNHHHLVFFVIVEVCLICYFELALYNFICSNLDKIDFCYRYKFTNVVNIK